MHMIVFFKAVEQETGVRTSLSVEDRDEKAAGGRDEDALVRLFWFCMCV
jgi:hypothetical protein